MPHRPARLPSTLVLLLALPIFLPGLPARAGVLYVNNEAGDDRFDGRAPVIANVINGPVATIGRAVRLAEAGDTIEITATSVPYFEAVTLHGPRNSGQGTIPLTINGNGAIVDGAVRLPVGTWKPIRDNLWRITPLRKGHYQLVLGEQAVPEFRVANTAHEVPDVPPGQWCAWQGSIYYEVPDHGDPNTMPLRIAVPATGLTFYDAHGVVVRNITFRFFRLDGINAHDRCDDVLLENVKCIGNGRAGLTVAGTSEVIVRNCELLQNLRHSALLTELGAAEIVESQLDADPTIKK